MSFVTEYSPAVTAARLRDGQPVSTAALAALAQFERYAKAALERSKLLYR
jgi:hypothetical protein